MRLPRPRIADLMVLVGITALGSAAYRAVGHSELFLVGAVPMAVVLAVVWVVGRRRRGVRAFLACGVAALALYILVAAYLRHQILFPYLGLVLFPLLGDPGPNPSPVVTMFAYAAAAVVLTVPQLTFALIGGYFFRTFRDSPAPDSPGPTP